MLGGPNRRGRSFREGGTESAMHEYQTRRRIEFGDTDMSGIAHFARFLIFMETAEHEFLEQIGTCVVSEQNGKRVLWPHVAVSCEYRNPVRFGDVLDIHFQVMRKGRKSLTYRCRFELDGLEIAVGQVTVVCCEMEQGEPVRSIPIPPHIAERIDEAPPKPE